MRSLQLTLAVAAGMFAAAPVCAQPALKYPVKPVRMLSGAFGSPSDNIARILGAKLAEQWASRW